MSSYFSNNNDGRDELSSNNEAEDSLEDEEEHDLEESLELDRALFTAVKRNDSVGVQQALRNGANVNGSCSDSTPLMKACYHGYNSIVRILLDAGADPWLTNPSHSALDNAILGEHLSTVEMLLNHDNGLLELESIFGKTPLMVAINSEHFEIVRFLLDRGANALVTTKGGRTTLMYACQQWADLEIVRQLLAAGVPVDACGEYKQTTLHYAATDGNIDVMRVLIVDHNADMFAVNDNGNTPFDLVTHSYSAGRVCPLLIECYSNILTQEHGRLALHAVLTAAEYSFDEASRFHPPHNPLRIHLPLGRLTLQHFRTLLSTVDAESIRNRDASGKLPIHMACQANAPVEVLSMLVEMDPTTLQISDDSGALPMHLLFSSDHPIEYSSVRYLVEQGGVGTLAARNRDGALPLHALCGSTNPSLQAVQYLIQSFSGSVAARTKAGQYPFMIAACESSTASLSVVYELVRTNPDLIVPR